MSKILPYPKSPREMDDWEIKMHQRHEDDASKASDAMKALINTTNGGSTRHIAAGIAHALRTEHRTLQQLFFVAFRQAMHEYIQSGSDARNEGAIKLAKLIADSDVHLPFI